MTLGMSETNSPTDLPVFLEINLTPSQTKAGFDSPL